MFKQHIYIINMSNPRFFLVLKQNKFKKDRKLNHLNQQYKLLTTQS